MNLAHCQIKFAAIVKIPFRPHLRLANLRYNRNSRSRVTKAVGGHPGGHP
jgi:hypothetical protein